MVAADQLRLMMALAPRASRDLVDVKAGPRRLAAALRAHCHRPHSTKDTA
ncbi:MAG: hypothetical protein JO124_16615 [Hyphomicrobiales bacterium]|nr:hypothetical protein [Hyphomicrobiales bacterium]MBV9977041.1 hypothetical protein [Hyphomicrobiales bacterium]